MDFHFLLLISGKYSYFFTPLHLTTLVRAIDSDALVKASQYIAIAISVAVRAAAFMFFY